LPAMTSKVNSRLSLFHWNGSAGPEAEVRRETLGSSVPSATMPLDSRNFRRCRGIIGKARNRSSSSDARAKQFSIDIVNCNDYCATKPWNSESHRDNKDPQCL